MSEQMNDVAVRYVIVTRFNVNMDGGLVKTKELSRINPAVDTSYLTRRFALFQRYTVPSIRAQSNQNFLWIVLFHADTPQAFQTSLAQLAQEYPAFHPLFIADDQDYKAVLTEYLLAFAAKRYCITRIDNDDALHLDFMQQVQQIAQSKPQGEYVILFPYGVQYHQEKGIASNYLFEHNHFSTLVTDCDGTTLKNAFDYNHMRIAEDFLIERVLLPEPMWLEVIHDSNVSNRMHIAHKNILREQDALSVFGVDVPIEKQAYRTAWLYALFVKPINAVRLFKMYGIKGFYTKALEKLKR